MCKNNQFYYICYIYYMLPTGYNILNGGVAADLSTIFEPLPEGGTMYATPTGFIQYSTGKDLRELFAVNTSYTIPYNTNWIAQNGQDLRYIFQGIAPPPLLVTITGGTAPTPIISGNKYTYTFTSGTRQISINKNVTLNVIVVGGGGPGGPGWTNSPGGGGGGGGFGYVSFSYVSGTIYNISVASVVTVNGQSSTFLNKITGKGVTATGGARGGDNLTTSAASGLFTYNEPISAYETRTGGRGGAYNNGVSGENSSGIITVLGVNYNYGGGGAPGWGSAVSSTNNRGGKAGANGVGGSGPHNQLTGQSATTQGSGGGGGAWFTTTVGGTGGPGLVIVIFTYP
jgi:hypothetical protein